MFRRKSLFFCVLLIGFASLAPKCDFVPVEFLNDGFDDWCGPTPCEWEVEDGGIVEPAPTWHKKDLGAKMVSERVVMSQVATTAASCIRLQLVADVPADCELFLEFDVANDEMTHPEKSVRLPSGSWKKTVTTLQIPPWAMDTIRIILRKEGAAPAILALVRIESDESCAAADPSDWERPFGADCGKPESCLSGFCELIPGYGFFPEEAAYCSSCSVDADCEAGESCGLELTAYLNMAKSCVPSGMRALGERCVGDRECASATCCQGVCSACCNDPAASCPGDQACSQAPSEQLGIGLFMPFQCEPGQHSGLPHSPCIANSDCISNSCAAQENLSLCESNGQPCVSSVDCPFYTEDYAISFDDDSDKCSTLGLKGGHCE